jgi:protein gp37
MAETSKIEWTDATFNPWIGCTKVSPACDHCYAEVATPSRTMGVMWGPQAERKRTSTSNWRTPITWNNQHARFFEEHGRRRRVFCASLADVYDNAVDPEWRADLFELIQQTPNLDWLILTKRVGNVERLTPFFMPENVRIGATICNQEEADRDIPKLLDLTRDAGCRNFLSIEPLLGPIDLTRIPYQGMQLDVLRGWEHPRYGIHWVIVGGESGGAVARPMHPDWARSLRDQCASAGVPFLFKQWGEWLPWSQFCDAGIDDPPEQTRFETREHADGAWSDVGKPDYWATMDGDIDDEQCAGRVGKKAAGRLLDGVEHNGVPA